jgi:hypothetical protein
MEINSPDPRFAILGGVAAGLASERVRRTLGRGLGYAARGVLIVTGPVVGAGRDVYDSARDAARPPKETRPTRPAKAT